MEDLELIDDFRRKVEEHDFVLFKYRDVQGRDKWSCICSAMDWITVGMEYISDVKNGKRSCTQSMEMFAYIASIDVVWEAVQQINRVLYNTDKIPFENDKACFKEKLVEQDDNNYFKTLRACFGAHPVNLKNKKTNERYFASWSGDVLEGYNVLLYSNKVGKGFRTIYLKMNEINEFLEKRYGYLNRLMDEIDRQYAEYTQKMSNAPIEQSDNICEQLEILKNESSKRLELHKSIVGKLIMIFNTPIANAENDKMVNQYKDVLKPVVGQIYNSLQTLEYDGVDYDVMYPTTDKLQNGYYYYIEKISNYIYGAGYAPTLWEPRLQEIFKGHFVMEYESYEELYILIISCIHKLK